ncbi:MAG: DNA topoisomerase III [Proteobacteria bacterium]|nr:MAG: DNA topoisomerase III [Pseudomonadota bacterium]
MVTLVIAEKPSVARDIARVLGASGRREGYLEGAGYRVSWCVGHLLELCEPHDYDPAWKRWDTKTLPMVPARFMTRARKGAGKQLAVLRKLARAADVERVVNACDAGREGELIFRFVWEAVGPKRGGPAVQRLWISSLTDKAIRAGMARLQDARAFNRLGDAARCRAEADWLVGMNATRALTLLARRGGARGRTLYSVGRVQTPTLAMLCRREDEIEAFEPEPFWQVKALFDLDAPARRFEALYTDPKGGDRLAKPEQAVGIAVAVHDRPARVGKVERKQARERPPVLYDLTALQQAANRRYGMSAQRTLSAAQALYERHKAITYPRTDSRFVTADVAAKLPTVVARYQGTAWGAIADAAMRGGPRPTRRIVNPAEVGDHHAILPTGKVPAPGRLGGDEQRVYDLVARRLLAVHLPDAVFARTTLEAIVAGEQGDHRFVAKGTARLAEGWQLAEPPSKKRAAELSRGQALPVVAPGEPARVAEVKVHEGKTAPPKPYTEATLLAGMEHAGKALQEDELRRAMRASGLGTPATRASIIETLLTRGYVERHGKALRATAQGRALVKALPVEALTSPELTGRWEAALAEMADGRGDRAAFMGRIAAFTTQVVRALREAEPPASVAEAAVAKGEAEVLGACPVCGEPVREGFKAYTCATGRGCDFVIFKQIAKRKVSPALARVLLSRRRSRKLKGFRSKKGKRFEAALVLGDDGKVTFDFGHRAGAAGRAPARRIKRDKAPADPRPRCPQCKQGRVIEGRRGWGCSRYREGCDFVVWFEQGPRRFRVPSDEADRLFRKKQTRLMVGLVDDTKARLVLDLGVEGNVRIELAKRR